jgi:hypothetical protein
MVHLYIHFNLLVEGHFIALKSRTIQPNTTRLHNIYSSVSILSLLIKHVLLIKNHHMFEEASGMLKRRIKTQGLIKVVTG